MICCGYLNNTEFVPKRNWRVYVRTQCNLRLEFKGVSHTADVFFDDVFVVHHYNAHTPFCGIVKNAHFLPRREGDKWIAKIEV